MESFETILRAGGHTNSLGRSNEVLAIIKADSTMVKELYDCIYAEDAWIRMRAMDIFEKLVRENPKLAIPYTGSLIDELTRKDQPSIQWHLAQLFAEIELNPLERSKAISWLQERISTTDVDWIVSVNVMKTLLYFRNKKYAGDEELRPLFNIQTKHHSKTVRKKAKLFLDELGS